MVKAILIKPLDGMPEGTEREFDQADFDRLRGYGAVRAASVGLRDDGPTVGEYVAAGYLASNYPPSGYASRSSPEEVAAAIAAASPPPIAPANPAPIEGEKAAPAVQNKKAPPVENKTALKT